MEGDGFVYLDFAASAPAVDASLAAERAYEEAPYAGANPNSLHSSGRQAARALDGARAVLARCLGGGFRPSELVFTSGGTESNNLAVLGLAEGARARDRRRTRVIVSAIEHDSVLDLVPTLRARGFEPRIAPARRDGTVDVDAVAQLSDQTTALVSVMAANNETGVVQPLAEIAHIAHGAGALVHSDAVQAFCRVSLSLDEVDAVSVAAHKIGGPTGVGALALRRRAPLRPQSFGGGQEKGLRAGTQDVRGALAFAAAAQACRAARDRAGAITRSRADVLVRDLRERDPLIAPSVDVDVPRLPGIVSLLVGGVDSQTLVLELDRAGFAVSAGSACSAGAASPSHVLLAMGIPGDVAACSLRVSFDERVDDAQLARFADALVEIAASRRGRFGGAG